MKIMWSSDGTWHCTGYGVQTKLITKRLVKDHKVYAFCAGAFHGGYIEQKDGVISIGAGGGDDRYGNRSVADLINWVDPDVLVTWLDVHGMENYGWSAQPVYMWAPIDTSPIPKNERMILGRAMKILVPSKWGQQVLKDAGFESTYVPCGVDMKAFYIDPEGGKEFRSLIRPEIDDDAFLVGMVGLNTGSPDRKGYGYAFDVLKAFKENHPKENIVAYLHTDPAGQGGAINLYELREQREMNDWVAFSPPQMPWGFPDEYMRHMFNAFDVLLHTSVTEGFGVPVVEAQACGTPVVVNACTSVTELAQGPGAYPVPYLVNQWVNTSTNIYIPDVRSMTLALEAAFADWKQKKHDPIAIRDSVLEYDEADVFEKYWKPALADVPAKIDYEETGGKLGPKLMLGSGKEKREDDNWVYHDREKLWDHIDVAHDLTRFPWPFEDEQFGYIEMSDVMEHLRGDLTEVMNELHRILKPGGFLYIHTAEAGSWQHIKDPTHVRGFFPSSFNYYDPSTGEGGNYSYSTKGWKIIKRTLDNGGLVFVMTPRKSVVWEEHYPSANGEHVESECATCLKEPVGV